MLQLKNAVQLSKLTLFSKAYASFQILYLGYKFMDYRLILTVQLNSAQFHL